MSLRLAIIFIFCLTAELANSAEATFMQVKDAFDREQFLPAKQGFLALAREGDMRAMFYLGVIYERGLGVEKNTDTAFAWYENAALNGHPEAQYNLGNAFKHGRGVVQSEELATMWWQKAADQQQANAQYNLALQYYFGKGVKTDSERAIFYIQQAATNGHATARELITSGQIPGSETPEESSSPAGDESELISEARTVDVGGGRAGQLIIYKPAWWAAQDSQAFIIQLAVMSNQRYLESFLLSHQLLDIATVVEKIREDKKLYYVVLGVFADKAPASQSLQKLSPTLKNFKPWVRPLSELQ